jgi:hypothetical protein
MIKFWKMVALRSQVKQKPATLLGLFDQINIFPRKEQRPARCNGPYRARRFHSLYWTRKRSQLLKHRVLIRK